MCMIRDDYVNLIWVCVDVYVHMHVYVSKTYMLYCIVMDIIVCRLHSILLVFTKSKITILLFFSYFSTLSTKYIHCLKTLVDAFKDATILENELSFLTDKLSENVIQKTNQNYAMERTIWSFLLHQTLKSQIWEHP